MDGGDTLRRLAAPRNLLRTGAAVLGVLAVALGFVQLGALGNPCGPGETSGVGTIERLETTGSPGVSTVTLRGSATDYRFGTDLTPSFGRGDFVVICGAAAASGVEATTIRHAQDPAAAAGPYLALGVALLACLALDLLMPRLAALPWPDLGAFFARLARLVARRPESGEAEGTDDNHSGAPAPKN